MENLSIVLKRRRKELGLTLAQVADAMGVAEATVQRWESGNIKSIRYEKIGRLAEILEVSPASFMGWSETTDALPSNVHSLEPMGLDHGESLSISDESEKNLIGLYRGMNAEGREKLLDTADDMVQSGKYKKSNSNQLGTKEA